MKFSKLISNTLISGLTVFGASVILPSAKVSAAACPDPTTTTITSLANGGDSTSFYQTTENREAGEGGYCEGTPTEYGVTVFKMGFCTKDPGDPTGSSPRAGLAPDYTGSNCTFTYENESGEAAAFGAGSTFNLSDTFATKPATGTYQYAVILINKNFDIKAKFGPIGPVGGTRTTYYTTTTFKEPATSTTDTPPTSWAAQPSPLNTFDSEGSCEATTQNLPVSGGSISAYLLNSSGKIIQNDSGASICPGVDKLFGVMKMSSAVKITDKTKALKATFVVTDNGATVILDNSNNWIEFDSGPFSVSFEVVE